MMTFVIFLLLIHESQHASAAVVQAYEKEPSILLPYKYFDHYYAVPDDPIVSWNWSGSGLDVIIHRRKDDGDDLKKQYERYRGRTSMAADALDSGDFSLTLTKPQMSDSGNYTCTIWTGWEWLRLTEIQLQVKDDQVVVKGLEGAESVRLPCKTSPHLPEDARVEWIHPDSERMVVHVHQNKSDDLTTQDRSYYGRTEMNKDLLKTGDLSLTIKYPTERDSGTYICILYVKGDSTKQRVDMHHVKDDSPSWIVVLLIVISVGSIITLGFIFYIRFCIKSDIKTVVVESGVESVQLPCKATTAYPMKDIRVEWTDSDNDIVYMYEKGSKASSKEHQAYRSRTEMNTDQVQTEDFSLTLKFPTDKDNYTYTCTVYNNDNKILLTKQVELKVKVCQVKVEEGAESVKLPFRTTPDLSNDVQVRWFYYKDDEPKKLYVYSKASVKQHDDYINRTEMNEDPLGSGDLSLTLKDPKDTDSGKYRCYVKKNKDVLTMKTVVLEDKDGLRKAGPEKDRIPLLTAHKV